MFRVHSEFQPQIKALFKDFSRTFTMLFNHQDYQYEITLFHRNQSHNKSNAQEMPTNIVKQLSVSRFAIINC